MQKLLPYCLLSVLLLVSCKKEAADIQPALPATSAASLDPATAFLRAAQSSPAADEYISGIFDGTPLYCATDNATGPVNINTLYLNKAQHTESGYLAKETPRGDVRLSISFMNTELLQQAMPYSWPHPNPGYCQGITIEVGQIGPHQEQLAYFTAVTGQFGIPVQITSVKDGVVEGTFEGLFYQYINGKYAGNLFAVKEGKFRIKTRVVSL